MENKNEEVFDNENLLTKDCISLMCYFCGRITTYTILLSERIFCAKA